MGANDMVDEAKKNGVLAMVTEIVSAHLSNNTVPVADIPKLIHEVYGALTALGQVPVKSAERAEPAVSVKKSVTADYIVCLEDGKKLKMLKRHLMTHYNMTPDEYRQKWGLNADYPMVAPNYAEQRRTLAKKIGLGTKRRRTTNRK
jgi:predicted transcriptional regulator